MPKKGAKVKPFQRDTVDLVPHGKTWQVAKVHTLAVGDIVANRGEVRRIADLGGVDGDPSMGIYFGTDEHKTWCDPDEEVRVFR